MINENSVRAVDKERFSQKFYRPLYSSYCFSQIPATIQKLLGLKTPHALPPDCYEEGPFDHVVLFFLDGFGWRFFTQFQDKIPLLKQGRISKLTSLFPSTTAAHVTCLNTGQIPAQSGIYEWFQYEPSLNALIAPLLYTYARHKKNPLPLDPKTLFPSASFYQTLKDEAITPFVIQPASIVPSVYSTTLLQNATVLGYETLEQGFDHLCSLNVAKSFRSFYFPDIDSIAHRHGTQSPEIAKALTSVCAHIEKAFFKLGSKTAILITADHGMIDVSPKNTYYLNKHIPNLEKFLHFGQDHKPLVPAGSCRDLFLHVYDERLDELRDILTEFLQGKAEVYTTAELIEQGLFGQETPSETFLSRVGNLVVLPFAEQAVWWHEKGRFEQNFYAAHGGLTAEELHIPFSFSSF